MDATLAQVKIAQNPPISRRDQDVIILTMAIFGDPSIQASISVVTSSALQAKIQALVVTMHHLLQQSKSVVPLQVESNCLLLVETINDQQEPPWEVRALFAEAAALLPCFSHLRIRFCRREANFAADWATKAHGNGSLHLNRAASPPPSFLGFALLGRFSSGL